MSVGVITTVYGGTYYGFLDQWGAAICELDTTPELITIVHGEVPSDIKTKVSKRLNPRWIFEPLSNVFHPQVHVNVGIASTFTDWIVKVDVDDVPLPDALNNVQECEADVLNFRYRIGERDYISFNVSSESILQKAYNPISSRSPFPRRV